MGVHASSSGQHSFFSLPPKGLGSGEQGTVFQGWRTGPQQSQFPKPGGQDCCTVQECEEIHVLVGTAAPSVYQARLGSDGKIAEHGPEGPDGDVLRSQGGKILHKQPDGFALKLLNRVAAPTADGGILLTEKTAAGETARFPTGYLRAAFQQKIQIQ